MCHNEQVPLELKYFCGFDPDLLNQALEVEVFSKLYKFIKKQRLNSSLITHLTLCIEIKPN